MLNSEDLSIMLPSRARELCRRGELVRPTAGISAGYTQANLVVLPRDLAYDFLVFCQRNPKPCPLLDVTEPGFTEARLTAPGSDLGTDLPKYRVWEKGELIDEPIEVRKYWNRDMVGFLLGCSFTFEGALLKRGIPVRHIEEGRNVPMYITNIQCEKAGSLEGPMVVSMRPVPSEMITGTVLTTARFPSVHGAPVHIGDPAKIGIKDISRPDFGESVTVKEGEVPIFWACGVTPQAALMRSKPSFAITHSPGYMFITDRKDDDYAVF